MISLQPLQRLGTTSFDKLQTADSPFRPRNKAFAEAAIEKAIFDTFMECWHVLILYFCEPVADATVRTPYDYPTKNLLHYLTFEP
jgi:hypothetical protein